jgi:hypothetical protein
MTLKRLEILLPLNYNDGKSIEEKKFVVTHRELLKKFGATTVDATRASGSWVYGGALHEDVLVRIVIDAFEPEAAIAFLRQYKETLKARFEQLDIWITAHDIEVI